MGQKNLRLKEIKDILQNQQIHKQEELLSILQRRGFDITQATLSRDLTSLHVARKKTNRGAIYFIPETLDGTMQSPADLLYGARSLRFSGQMGVLKTLPGYANSVGALIDNKDIPKILGTIAGNDTVLLILEENASHDTILDHLGTHFSNIFQLI